MDSRFSMVRPVPYMGVIWATNEASKLGYYNGHPDWCNLGQGQPEVGVIPGAPPRISDIALTPQDHAYGPLGGTVEVRQAICDFINRSYRQGKSQYTIDNISFASGGRLTLTRLFSILADGDRVGYKNPDYTAYEDYLNTLRQRCVLMEIRASEEDAFSVPPEKFMDFIHQERLDAFVFSNPCNPTGEVIKGEDLKKYVEVARKENCLLGVDEFYSTYIYNEDGSPADAPVSVLSYVEDIENDPVVAFDGLTKGFRYPGWRCGWAVGPKYIIEMINRAASAVDGGPSTPAERAAIEALKPGAAEQELTATRKEFAAKRKMLLEGLERLGIRPVRAPLGTFYLWCSVKDLPGSLSDADEFFFACLKEKVMTVPGHFFDVRPFRTRPAEEPLKHWVRFSYGPDRATIEKALARIEKLVKEARG